MNDRTVRGRAPRFTPYILPFGNPGETFVVTTDGAKNAIKETTDIRSGHIVTNVEEQVVSGYDGRKANATDLCSLYLHAFSKNTLPADQSTTSTRRLMTRRRDHASLLEGALSSPGQKFCYFIIIRRQRSTYVYPRKFGQIVTPAK